MSIDKLCSEYTRYLKIDQTSDIKSVEESIDETLTRLEEFETLLVMVRSDVDCQLATSVFDKKEDILKIAQKVKFLEEIVSKVKATVEEMENKVLTAESELKTTTESRLRSMIKPLFFGRSEVPARAGSSREQIYTPPEIFNSNNFFL